MSTPTAPPAISQLLYLLDEAFEATTNEQSPLGNLRALVPEDWLWVPAGGYRSICDIVRHAGGYKFMYHDYAFGGATLTWEDPLVDGVDALASSVSAIAWLRAGQQRLCQSIAAPVDDAELLRPRLTNWGEREETRWIIAVMIQHDLYHVGEINHLRPRARVRVAGRMRWLRNDETAPRDQAQSGSPRARTHPVAP
jgi:DinB superfamily